MHEFGRTMAALLAVVSFAAGCSRTGVKAGMEASSAGLARPARVLVYDFAVSAKDVSENQGLFGRIAHAASDTTQDERELQIGREVADRMAQDLVAGIREMGLPAERARRDTPVRDGDLLVGGKFLNVDEGNRARRLVIGLGAGASSLDTEVLVRLAGGEKLLEFTTHTDSGKMPGAAVTMGAGAAAQGGVTAGAAVANAAVGGVKGYRSEVEAMAGKSAEQAVAYLSEFFAKRGWIAADKVKHADRTAN